MNKYQLLIITFSIAVLVQSPSSDAEVIIAHARLCQEEDPFLRNQDERVPLSSVFFDVLEVGRGHLKTESYAYQFPGDKLHTNVVCVYIHWKAMTKPLPVDAILILSNDGWESGSSYYIVAPMPWRTILPYSPEAWEETMKKTDAELIGDPLAPELALAVAEKNAIEKGATPENIYLLNPRGDAKRWVVNVFYYQDPDLYEYALWLNDRGDLLDETMPMINDYYKPGEDLAAFMAREYANDNRGVPLRLQPHPSTSETPPAIPTAGRAPAQ